MHGVDKAIYDLISDNEHIRAIMKASSKEKVNCMPHHQDAKINPPMVTYYESDSDSYLGIPGCQIMTYRLGIYMTSLEASTRLSEVIKDVLSVKDFHNEYARVLKFTLFTQGDTFDQKVKTHKISLIYKVIAIDKQLS